MKKIVLFAMMTLLGMTQLGAQEYEYVPFVREGVKWVCFYDNDVHGVWPYDDLIPNGIHYYALEMKGDTCIDGKWYKPVHYYSGNGINELNDTVPVYVREENKVVYGIIPDDRRYWECPIGIGTIARLIDWEIVSNVSTGVEFILYDFNNPVVFYENLDPFLCSRLQYLHTEMAQIGNHLSKKLVFDHISSDPDGQYYGSEPIIEGIGYAGDKGAPFNYFYVYLPYGQIFYRLCHVIENGQIIYKTRWYNPDVTLGINEVVTDVPQRQLDGNYYNLMGQPVGKDVPTVPGIYIHQGKKILVR